ncbi:MAG: sulfite exporter TauE/SafE family protein [Ruminococcaceae bacterium]|nr:sulfite exporter TauE/SafE family protein [Oscillospiraceae bacterium]
MKPKIKQNLLVGISGFAIGTVNGILGAGGGMLAVPFLKKLGFSQKEAHQNAIAVILPITVISAVFYIIKGNVTVNDSLIYIPTGLLGALLGTYLLKKISPKWLKRLFGALMVYAGFRLLFR